MAVELKADVLPLGVLIPTRNSMAWLERHVSALRLWSQRVQEVVVVDSQSSDGTPEYLRRHLSGPNVKHLSHPPGLYESWNYGLGQIRSQWSYIATVGDRISEAAIIGLVTAGQESSGDLVISPPSLVSTTGDKLDKQWPVHKFIQWKDLRRPGPVSGIEVFLWNALSVPGSLLGSSASNIYRTDYIQSHPFPVGYRHACDTAWAITNSFAARWVVAPDLYSELLVHPAVPGSPEPVRHQSRERLHELARELFRSIPDDAFQNKPLFENLLDGYWGAALAALQADRNYTGMRHRAPPWFLRPAAWRERTRRKHMLSAAAQARARILDALSGIAGASGGR
ncbi:MAG TPA: glycosyltransferase family A protein [Gammaproteobacteria bacterium]|nr:glycosyltransferase family A protein [Gammaproteobacteria bacterium]